MITFSSFRSCFCLTILVSITVFEKHMWRLRPLPLARLVPRLVCWLVPRLLSSSHIRLLWRFPPLSPLLLLVFLYLSLLLCCLREKSKVKERKRIKYLKTDNKPSPFVPWYVVTGQSIDQELLQMFLVFLKQTNKQMNKQKTTVTMITQQDSHQLMIHSWSCNLVLAQAAEECHTPSLHHRWQNWLPSKEACDTFEDLHMSYR